MKRVKLRVVILLLTGFLASSATTLSVLVPKAAAQSGPSAEWIDRAHILVHERVGAFSRDRVYTDTNSGDDNYNFKDRAQSDPCQSELWINGTPPNASSGDLIVIVTDSHDNNCQLRWSGGGGREPGEVVMCEGPDGRPLWDRKGFTNTNGGDCDLSDNNINAGRISIETSPAAAINFRFVDQDTIESLDGNDTYNRSQGDQNEFILHGSGSCRDLIKLDGGTQTIGGQTVRTGELQERSEGDNGGCHVDHRRDAFVTEEADPGGGATGGDEEDESSCEEDGVLAWIVCPVIKILGEAIDFLDSRIQALLTVPESDYNNPQLHAVWARLRNIAVTILVPIMLVMVIGTALGFDFISAYTVKRAMPRLIIAAIFIVLSWNIMVLLIRITNDVGHGILGLMTSAFAGPNGTLTLASLFDPSGSGLSGGMAAVLNAMIIGGTVAGVAYVATHAGGLLLFFAGLVVLALIVGFVVLTLRQLLILALTLVSPLAILAWIFPGNDKLWKIWWQTFSKLLLMFPLIMLLIGSGRILALVISQTRTDFADGLLGPIFKIIAWVIPYAFIFTVIKASSSLLNTLTGGVFNFQARAREGLSSRYKERGMDQLKTQSLQRRERMQNWAQKKIDASSGKSRRSIIGRAGGRVFRGAMGGVSKGAGGYNLQAAISAQRAARNKELADEIATGDDTEIRASTADAELIRASYGGIDALRRNKNFTEGEDYRVDENGNLQLRNISGNYYDASKAQAGYERWGDDQYALQKQLSYEMYKASSEGEVQSITDNALGFTRSHGISDSQGQGMWIGAAYENQNSKLEYKHTKLRDVSVPVLDAQGNDTGETRTEQRYVLDGQSFAKELYEKRGTYDMSKMSSHTIDSMATAYDQAEAHSLEASSQLENAQAQGDEVGARRAQNALNAARQVQEQIRASHATLTQRARGGPSAAPIGQAGEEGAEQPVYGGGGMGIGAPAHVEARLADLGDHIRRPEGYQEEASGRAPGNTLPPRPSAGNGNGGRRGRGGQGGGGGLAPTGTEGGYSDPRGYR